MKLHEITGSNEFLTDPVEIRAWLNMNVVSCNYTISDAGIVSFNEDVYIKSKKAGNSISQLQIQFGEITGSFNVTDNDLTSLKGFPSLATQGIYIQRNPQLTSLEHITRSIGNNLDISNTGITSLVGIADLVDKIDDTISISPYDIKEGGLGLLQIPNLKYLNYRGAQDTRRPTPWDIIRKYLHNKKDNIIECQSELIEAGFEEYAQL